MKSWRYLVICIVLIPLGLGTKWYRGPCERWVHSYAGDVLIATFFFFALRCVWRKASRMTCAVLVFGLCVAIEFSQLIHTPFLNQARQNFWGAVALGSGFDWADIVYYALGIGLAVVGENFFQSPHQSRHTAC